MANPVAILVSQDPAIIETVGSIIRNLPELRLETFADLRSAGSQLERDDVALVLVHLARAANERSALEFAQTAAGLRKTCPTLIVSDEYRSHQAVAFLRAGAADYFGLPQDLTKLAYLIDVLTLRARGAAAPAVPPAARPRASQPATSSYLLDPELVEIMDQVRRVVAQDTTVLLTGETGTGKTRLARLIHELSPRRDEPFLTIDCASLSTSLIESEMFGHAKGAFTGAERDRPGKLTAVGRGTLLLDEINALPMALQSKLLRVVDERVYEPVGTNQVLPLQARLIAVSNTPLEDEVNAGSFRADLYYRLNVVCFYLPPLRERKSAIGPLAHKFLAEYSARNGRDLRGFTPEAVRLMTDHDWPGNIRELRNAIERAVLLAPGTEVQASDLPETVRPHRAVACSVLRMSTAANGMPSMTMGLTKEEFETLQITEALMKHGNNRLKAAAELGISRMALYKRMHKYGLMQKSPKKSNGTQALQA